MKDHSSLVCRALLVIGIAIAGSIGCSESSPSNSGHTKEETRASPSSDAAKSEIVYLDGHSEPVRAVGISPDGSYLVSVGDDSRVIVRSARNPQQKEVFKPVPQAGWAV